MGFGINSRYQVPQPFLTYSHVLAWFYKTPGFYNPSLPKDMEILRPEESVCNSSNVSLLYYASHSLLQDSLSKSCH